MNIFVSLRNRLFFILSLLYVNLYAQPQQSNFNVQIQVGQNIVVGTEPPEKQLIEPQISAHPNNPNYLLAVGWVFPTSGENGDDRVEHCVTFTSEDGGKTWIRNNLSCISCADPWVSLSKNGAMLTALARHPLLPDSTINQLTTYFSVDNGKTWNMVPQSLCYNHDGPQIVAAADKQFYDLILFRIYLLRGQHSL